MARIRSVHPGLFTDEAFMQLTVSAPLAVPLLIGLWGEADDQGTFEWKPLTIKARILPAVPADVSPLLDALVEVGFIRRYEADGRSYGAIRNFRRWQRPEKPKVLHPLPDELRPYVGLVADRSPKDRRPVGDQLPNLSAEVGGRLEEVGCKPTEPSISTEARPPAPARAHEAGAPAAAADPAVAQVIAAFDEAGQRHFSPATWGGYRPHPAAKDHTSARAMLEAGADPALCAATFDALLAGMAAKGQEPPRTLSYARGAVSDALASIRQGLPPPRAPTLDSGGGETLAERARRITEVTERRMAREARR